MPSLAGSFRKSTPRMPSSANEAKSVHENDEDMQEANHADASVSLRPERQELTDQLTPQELTDLHAQELSEYWTRVNQETADNEAAAEAAEAAASAEDDAKCHAHEEGYGCCDFAISPSLLLYI